MGNTIISIPSLLKERQRNKNIFPLLFPLCLSIMLVLATPNPSVSSTKSLFMPAPGQLSIDEKIIQSADRCYYKFLTPFSLSSFAEQSDKLALLLSITIISYLHAPQTFDIFPPCLIVNG